jgi:ligand-binding sensor domain-containing protein
MNKQIFLVVIFIKFLVVHIDDNIFGQTEKVVFNTLCSDNGLSSNYTTSVVEDNFGFIWIGTNEGLNRWDGFKCEVFKNVPDKV